MPKKITYVIHIHNPDGVLTDGDWKRLVSYMQFLVKTFNETEEEAPESISQPPVQNACFIIETQPKNQDSLFSHIRAYSKFFNCDPITLLVVKEKIEKYR